MLIARTFFHILNFHYCGNLCIKESMKKEPLTRIGPPKRAFDAGMAFPSLPCFSLIEGKPGDPPCRTGCWLSPCSPGLAPDLHGEAEP